MVYDVRPSLMLQAHFQDLTLLDMTHLCNTESRDKVPLVFINHNSRAVRIRKGTIVAHFVPRPIEQEEESKPLPTTATVDSTTSWADLPFANYCATPLPVNQVEPATNDRLPATPDSSRMITSPADVDPHTKVKVPDAEVSPDAKRRLDELCQKYDDIFSKHSGDIGHTKLIEMNIETGDSPPLAQRPYTLPLKHHEWVRAELETLEKAGIITRSISPWASPIVIVPKRSEPDKPPEKRMCVDYRLLNTLLPEVRKGLSKAQGVLTLVPLPKIEHLFSKLGGAAYFSCLDLRAGYHHIGLNPESQRKSAFCTVFGKFEFKKVPFGLAQAPAYFQELMNRVLRGLGRFSFAYLDDVLIYSRNVDQHLEHLEEVFVRMREANLKLKLAKCDFFKKAVHYLGHIITTEGLTPIPDKIKSLEDMPVPTDRKETRSFLGLANFYRRFVPHYSTIARALARATAGGATKNHPEEPFEWTDDCQKAFETLKEFLIKAPILKYPDPTKPYVLFTDASGYAWAGLLTQEYTHEQDGKKRKVLHPVTCESGLFHGSQCNWATLTKEAYAIYQSARKMRYYIEDADVTLYSDHLPLKNFLHTQTLNDKVNRWSVELSGLRIKFRYIKGIKNTLADALSRVIRRGLAEPLPPEPPGQEFGCAIFDKPDPIAVREIKSAPPGESGEEAIVIQLSGAELRNLQDQDDRCQPIIQALLPPPDQTTQRQAPEGFFIDNNHVLRRKRTIDDQVFEVIVVPQVLIPWVLHQCHDLGGHNGSPRQLAYLQRYFYWRGMRSSVDKHVKACTKCRELNTRNSRYQELHLEVTELPMKLIAMDLIGQFPRTTQGNTRALTVIDMCTNYTWAIPIPDKRAATIAQAYIRNIFTGFGGSAAILSDNGTEFDGEMKTICRYLDLKQIKSSPYYPQGNGRIENFHNFLKSCVAKHVTNAFEWDECLNVATMAYNTMPHSGSRETPFFLMFGRDPILPITKLLNDRLRTYHDDAGLISIDLMRRAYAVAAFNLRKARERMSDNKDGPLPPKIGVGDPVMIRRHPKKSFESRYEALHRVIEVKDRQVVVRNLKGDKHTLNVKDVHIFLPADAILSGEDITAVRGRATRLLINLNNEKDLGWNLTRELINRGINAPQHLRRAAAAQQDPNTTNN